MNMLNRWTADKSAELYGIKEWGAGFFTVSDSGELMVTPTPGNFRNAASIPEIIKGIHARGLDMPVLLRIDNILESQVRLINESFRTAMRSLDYKGAFMGAYPIKVNQQQQVVEAVTSYGRAYHHGLEAGSKAELIAALGMLTDPEALLICNGYKDTEFIDLGLYATKMGFNCFLVVEMPGEVDLIMERSRALGIRPNLGMRVKLSSQAQGLWAGSGGDGSIFGLNTSQMVGAMDTLREADMLDCMQLLHYHLGSQIPNIRDIRTAVVEAGRIYAGLVAEGADMRYLDLGGGLAVDYDGTQTNFMSSRNYTLDEYCVDVVEGVMTVLDEHKVAHPTIITESGRALVAYYSMLLFNVLDVNRFEPEALPEQLPEDTHPQIRHLFEALKDLNIRNIQESFNDTLYYRDEVRQLFNHGRISFRERALAENVFWETVRRIALLAEELPTLPTELQGITNAISETYYCNFSVFQSLPDSWAIGQLFPILPIHRLNEEPTRRGILADITCDCDGKVDRFIDKKGMQRSMPLHEYRPGEEYVLGAMLVGAYQETLGDLHNLLGDTNIVTVRIQEGGDFVFLGEMEGDSVADILSYVEYDPKSLLVRFRETAESAVRQGHISPHERREIMRAYEDGLRGYTYYES